VITLASKRKIVLAAAGAALTATLSHVSTAYAQAPATAGSTGGSASVLGMGALALVGLAGILWQKLRARRHACRSTALQGEVDRLEAFLAASPDAWCGWSPDGTHAVSPAFAGLLGIGRCDRLEDIENALSTSDAAALNGVFSHLRQTGQPFQIVVTTADGDRVLELSGSRGTGRSGGETFDVLWARDIGHITGEIQRQTEARAAALRTIAEFHAALDQIPYPIWLRGADLSIAWCNKAYADAVELGRDEVIGQQRELASDPQRGSGRRLAEQATAAGGPRSETQHLVIGGARRLVEITEVPFPAGTCDMVAGYALDLTAQEDLRRELSRHVSAHGEVLEQLGSPIAIYGADTRLLFYNQAYVSLWGLDVKWLESEPTYGEIMEDLRARRRLPEHADFPRYKREQLAKFTSLIEPAEDLLHLPDGTTLRMLLVPHPFGGLMFILEDVTNALALESSYNTLMAVQQESLDNLAEGIAVFGGDGRLKLSNPAYARIWSLRPEDLNGEPHLVELVEKMKHFFDYGDDWEGFKRETIAGTLERAAGNGRLERVDGSVVEFSSVPLPDGAVLTSFLDVTDSVRVEQALRERNAALEAADRLKSEFIANVSYQLRTPLNAIMGFAEILANQYFGELNERQQEYSRAVLDSGQRLLLLINDILDLATVEAGFMVLERAPVDIPAMLGSVINLTRDWARKQSLRLDVDYAENIGTIDADEKRLKQAIFNLISNAIKFTPPGGRILVSAERVGGSFVLAVTDTGIGIPAADQERVFGRFERANPQARQTGAGLGLSLVKSFIELHGGRVEIDSRLNEGTCIRCILPVRSNSDAPAADARAGAGEQLTSSKSSELSG
jgi:signal transduction histidine kinase